MPIMQWSDSLSVGVREIDAQHKTLIMNLNDLFDAMKAGKASTTLKPLLAKLVAYTQMHFATEEKYMKQFDFADFKIHKNEHDGFVNRVAIFQAQYEAGKQLLSVDILTFLKDWVTGHIQGTDKKYSALFIEHGLS